MNDQYISAINYSISILVDSNEQSSLPARGAILYSSTVDTDDDSPCIQIVPSGFFDEDVYGTPKSLPILPLKEIEGVPLLFGEPEIERRGKRLIIYADIIASAYFLLTRYEEIVRREVRDQFGRFPGMESLPYRAGFIHRPIEAE